MDGTYGDEELYEEGEGDYDDGGDREDTEGLSDEHPQNIPPEIAPDVSSTSVVSLRPPGPVWKTRPALLVVLLHPVRSDFYYARRVAVKPAESFGWNFSCLAPVDHRRGSVD